MPGPTLSKVQVLQTWLEKKIKGWGGVGWGGLGGDKNREGGVEKNRRMGGLVHPHSYMSLPNDCLWADLFFDISFELSFLLIAIHVCIQP